MQLLPGDKVRMKLDHEKRWAKEGTIVTGNPEHRSYIVKTKNGTYRRNRGHLQNVPCASTEPEPVQNERRNSTCQTNNSGHIMKQPENLITSSSGRPIHPPKRYDDNY